MNAKISEIFRSIQGEGKYIGSPTVFVRFAECNIKCEWCDTCCEVKETLTKKELLERVSGLHEPGYFVSLTGGEPLLQWKFIKEILPDLGQKWIGVYLETNGILHKEFSRIKSGIDVVSMDFKLPSSTGYRAFWAEHREMMALAKGKDFFIKMVITNKTTREDLLFAVEMIASVNPKTTVYLQPNTAELRTGALERALEFQQYGLEFLSDVRVAPQIHKLLDLP